MFPNRWILAAALAGLASAGCDDSRRASQPPEEKQQTTHTAPATQPLTALAMDAGHDISPATRPVEEPGRTLAIAEGNIIRQYNFPPARLRLDRDQKMAILYSDDPKTAIQPGYSGNSYYLAIRLSDEYLTHPNGAEWHYKSATSEHVESADGIFLDGQRYHLQPSDVGFYFKAEGAVIRVAIMGEFFKFDTAQAEPDRSFVQVNGIVNATVDSTK